MVRFMREPFEPHRAAWHALAVLLGLSALVLPPKGLASAVPSWMLILWAFGLAASGVLGIAAPFRQTSGVISALAMERAALWIQTGTLLWVIISSLFLRGLVGLVGLVAYFLWIIANTLRDRRIASAVTKSRRPLGE
jgi:hypothetical protein